MMLAAASERVRPARSRRTRVSLEVAESSLRSGAPSLTRISRGEEATLAGVLGPAFHLITSRPSLLRLLGDHHHQCNLTKLAINIILSRFRYHGNALIPSTKTPSPNEGRNYIFEGASIIIGMEINCKI